MQPSITGLGLSAPQLRVARPRDSLWHKRKHGYTWRLLTLVHNGIAVARVQTSSMASNTCCTALLVQGTTASPP